VDSPPYRLHHTGPGRGMLLHPRCLDGSLPLHSCFRHGLPFGRPFLLNAF
jgi:hypothetical protein